MPWLAKIRELDCIGCTKCLQACPVDAIIGSTKQMHTVLIDECIGCKLCVEPCPMDCIDLQPVAILTYQPAKAKLRHQARKSRLAQTYSNNDDKLDATMKKATILAAVARSKQKKGE
jgi:electron transport complex protein RnfB